MTIPADPHPLRQLIYRSTSTRPAPGGDLADILVQSRMNNGLEGVSGLLLTNGKCYLQVLEGGPDAVAHVFDRIRADGRHTDVTILLDAAVERRSFGGWGMASAERDDEAEVRFRIERFLAHAPDGLRGAFEEVLKRPA